jgi:hypothetical protein
LKEQINKQKGAPLSEDPELRVADIDFKMTRMSATYTRISSIAKPKDPNAGKKGKKMPKNFKIDNITFDGNSDVDWNDFIKIDNGDGAPDVDDDTTAESGSNKGVPPEKEDSSKGKEHEDL